MDRLLVLKQDIEGRIPTVAARSPPMKNLVETYPSPAPLPCLLSPSIIPRHRRPQRSASCDHYDRFIPKRSSEFESEMVQFKISRENCKIDGLNEVKSQQENNPYKLNKDRAAYSEKMHQLCGKPIESKLFEFKRQKNTDRRDSGSCTGSFRALFQDGLLYRKLPEKPEQIFDVFPCILLDEPMSMNLMAYGLEEAFVLCMKRSVFVLFFRPGYEHSYKRLAKYGTETLDPVFSSVLWFDEGTQIALGSTNGTIQIYDARTFRKSGEISCDNARVNCLAWNRQSNVFCSGDGDGDIRHFDLRSPTSQICRFSAFEDRTSLSEVQFSSDGQYLAAGGTHSRFGVWRATEKKCYFKHDTTSKRKFSVAWCPWKYSSLATGGSHTADAKSGRISIWNIHSGVELSHVTTKTKINKLIWNDRAKELVSGHSCYPNTLQVWKYQMADLHSMGKIMGQHEGVADMAFNADQTVLGTIMANDKLHLWHYFEKKRQLTRSWNCLTALNQVIR